MCSQLITYAIIKIAIVKPNQVTNMPNGTKEHAKLRSQSKEISDLRQLANIKDSLDGIHCKLDDIDKCRSLRFKIYLNLNANLKYKMK